MAEDSHDSDNGVDGGITKGIKISNMSKAFRWSLGTLLDFKRSTNMGVQ